MASKVKVGELCIFFADHSIIFVRFFLFTHFDFSGLGKGMVSVPVMVLSTIDFKNWQDLKDLQK